MDPKTDREAGAVGFEDDASEVVGVIPPQAYKHKIANVCIRVGLTKGEKVHGLGWFRF